MHPRIRDLLLLVPAVALAACAATQQPPAVLTDTRAGTPSAADSASAHRAAEGFLAAFDSLQWERFSAYLADDVTMVFPFAQLPSRRDGREAVEEVFRQFFESQRSTRERSGRPMVQGIAPLDLRVQLAGPDAAIASFHLGTEQPSRRSVVFRRTADGWKVVHWHASPAPAPPPAPTPAPSAAPAPAPAAAAEVPLSAAERARYVGSYELGSQVPLRVRILEQDGRLFGQAAGQDAMPLLHVGDHTFESPNSRVVFTVEGGRATGFTLHQGSLTVTARRID